MTSLTVTSKPVYGREQVPQSFAEDTGFEPVNLVGLLVSKQVHSATMLTLRVGGADGNRTRVQTYFQTNVYKLFSADEFYPQIHLSTNFYKFFICLCLHCLTANRQIR